MGAMDSIKQKLERQLERLMVGVDPADRAAVEGATQRFSAALDSFLRNNPEFETDGRGERLRQARDELIAEHMEALKSKPGPPPEPEQFAAASRGFRGGFVTGLLAAFAVVVVVAVAGIVNNVLDISVGETAERKRLFENEFYHSIPHVEAMAEYAARVRDEIERRQAEDPESLEGVTDSRFVNIRNLDPNPWDDRPERLPRGVGLVVRADQEAYKVLVSGPLCRAAFLLRPELVDPERQRDGLSCTHFGYWNEAGEEL